MLFEVTHVTNYQYSDEVFFEPHNFRFRPKNTTRSSLKNFDIQIEPKPAGLSEQTDVEGNYILHCWFDGTHDLLKITSRFSIEVDDYNPFDFLVHPPQYLKLPFEYEQKTKQILQPALQAEAIDQSLLDFCNKILKSADSQSVEFFVLMTRELHKEFTLEFRETGKPLHPDQTFDLKAGSCRDLAWMQIHMLRQLGVASHFVSGYFYVDDESPEFELHAWVEAYLPGAGWIGMDPGHGMLTNAYHIPVVSSAFYEHTMPVSGTVRGSASSKMENELSILLTK
jgi:transglutaminase-like putative cysteine protease